MMVPVPPSARLDDHTLTSDDIAEHHRHQARRALDEAAESLGSAEHETVFAEGDPLPQLLATAREHSPWLLVAGSAARQPLDLVMRGSLAAELAASAPCPVVVVTDEAGPGGDGPVVAGYDGSEHGLLAARHAAALAARMGRDLVLVGVAEPGGAAPEPALDLATELHAAARACTASVVGAETRRLDVTVTAEEGDPVQEVERVAREHDAPLVVVGSRGLNALKAALLGSVSGGIVRSADRPVVVAGPASEESIATAARP